MLVHLKKHLVPLQRQGQITIWSDTDLNAGVEWEKELHTHLEQADIILLLISPDFMYSDYCYSTEMRKAIERHEQGNACVIPIILRATFWKNAPFAKLQVLPKDAKPVKSWLDLDEAFNSITEYITEVVSGFQIRSVLPKSVLPKRTKEEWLIEGNKYCAAGCYPEALAAYDQAIRLDHTDALAYIGKGNALEGLQRFEEALAAYDQAIHLGAPGLTNGMVFYYKGGALASLGRSEEAQICFDIGRSIRFNR